MAAIIDFRHTQTSDSIPTGLFVLRNPENMDMDVGMSLLTWLKAELYVIFFLLPIVSRHIGYMVGATLVLTTPYCSPAIFWKSHHSASINSKRLRNGSKISGLRGNFISSPSTYEG